MPNQKSQKPKYKVELDILGKKNAARGNTFEDACQNLGISWKDIKGRGIITVYKGNKKTKPKMFKIPALRRLVYNPLTQQIWARHFELLFSEEEPKDEFLKEK
jgi:hypothetical protein